MSKLKQNSKSEHENTSDYESDNETTADSDNEGDTYNNDSDDIEYVDNEPNHPFGTLVKSEIEKKFNDFMDKHKIFKDKKTGKYLVPITHTYYGGSFGSFHISDADYDTFINLYKRILLFKKGNLFVVERQKVVGPLLIDLDFRLDKKNPDRKYRIDHIEKVIKHAINCIYTNFAVNKSSIEVFVYEKDRPTYDSKPETDSTLKYKDGFHIVIPLPFSVSARAFISDYIKNKIKETKLFEDIPYTNKLGIDEICDDSVIYRNGWIMYGSKKENGSLYKLTHIYNGNLNIIKNNHYGEDEIVSLTAIRQFSEEDAVKLRKKFDTPEMRLKLQEYYDLFVNKKKKKDTKSNSKHKENLEKVNKKLNNIINKPRTKSKKAEINIAKQLVQLLSEKRATDYNDWIRVCWALKNVDECLYPAFLEFSKKCIGKFDENSCIKVWDDAHYSFSIASIHWWAKTDDPQGYAEVIRQNINEQIREAETGTHDDLAKVMYELYKHQYRCISVKKNIWYEFQGHKWVQIDSAYTLANKLSDELATEFATLSSVYFSGAGAEKRAGVGDMADKNYNDGRKIISIIEKLKNEGFKNQVIASCAKRFIESKFEEKLDDNKDLIGFDNGVFDLRPECFGFRPGVPDDYISMSVGYDYIEFKEDDEEIKDIMGYFKTVQQEDDLREYVLTLFSSFLDGHNRNQKFVLCTGSGCHAPGTDILMHNGTIKKVEKIKLNEEIMGDDGKPRKVICLFRGEEDLHSITLDNGDKFTVNKNHRLAVKNTFKSNIIEGKDIFDNECFIVVWYEYISGDNIPYKMTKSFLKLEDAEKFHQDTISQNPSYIFHNEVVPVKVIDFLTLSNDVRNDFRMVNFTMNLEKEFQKNPNIDAYSNAFEKGTLNTHKILHSKLSKRLEFIAGIVDKFGKIHEKGFILPKSIINQNNTEFLFRSVGIKLIFDFDESKNILLTGNNICNIPVKVLNKHASDIQHDNLNIQSDNYKIVSIDSVGKGMFYGFELDGNKRYVMGNMYITYNSNGKSTSIDLMQYTMGQYFGILPTTVITVKHKNSSGARPELANKKGKRFLVIQEPEHDDTIYVGQMKNLTGSDWIETRALYGDPFMYKPQFKLILVCNKLPFIPANDGGTWRRLRVIPWESEFVDKPDPKNPKQIKKDPELVEKLKDWKQGFMWILLNKYYQSYRKNGIKEPAKVTQFTDKYKKDSDIYYEFMKDNYIVTGIPKDYESVNAVHKCFVEWYKSQYGLQNIPSRKEVVAYIQSMDTAKIKIVNGNVKGIKTIFDDNNDDDDNLIKETKKLITAKPKESKASAD